MAYRIQENTYGGLKQSTVRNLRELAEDCASDRNSAILTQATSVVPAWSSRTPAENNKFIKAILDRVLIHPQHVEIRLRMAVLLRQLRDDNSPALDSDRLTATHLQQIVRIDRPFRHLPQGRAVKLIVGNTQVTLETSRLAVLSPARIEAFINGTGPALSLDALLGNIPTQWNIPASN